MLSEVLPSHRNISCDFVAKQMYGFIMDNLNYELICIRCLYPMFMIVVGYLSFVSIDTTDVNLLCLWVP